MYWSQQGAVLEPPAGSYRGYVELAALIAPTTSPVPLVVPVGAFALIPAILGIGSATTGEIGAVASTDRLIVSNVAEMRLEFVLSLDWRDASAGPAIYQIEYRAGPNILGVEGIDYIAVRTRGAETATNVDFTHYDARGIRTGPIDTLQLGVALSHNDAAPRNVLIDQIRAIVRGYRLRLP